MGSCRSSITLRIEELWWYDYLKDTVINWKDYYFITYCSIQKDDEILSPARFLSVHFIAQLLQVDLHDVLVGVWLSERKVHFSKRIQTGDDTDSRSHYGYRYWIRRIFRSPFLSPKLWLVEPSSWKTLISEIERKLISVFTYVSSIFMKCLPSAPSLKNRRAHCYLRTRLRTELPIIAAWVIFL